MTSQPRTVQRLLAKARAYLRRHTCGSVEMRSAGRRSSRCNGSKGLYLLRLLVLLAADFVRQRGDAKRR